MAAGRGSVQNRDRMAWVVLAVWAVVTLVAVVTKQAELVAIVTPVALVVLGFYFSGRRDGE